MTKTYTETSHLSYKYASTGKKTMRISNNITYLNVVGSSSNGICQQLNNVTSLNENITEIGSMCFAGLQKLEEMDLSNTKIQKIGDQCFSDCKKLKKVVLPSTISEIPKNLFKNSYKLTSVKFLGEDEDLQ